MYCSTHYARMDVLHVFVHTACASRNRRCVDSMLFLYSLFLFSKHCILVVRRRPLNCAIDFGVGSCFLLYFELEGKRKPREHRAFSSTMYSVFVVSALILLRTV